MTTPNSQISHASDHPELKALIQEFAEGLGIHDGRTGELDLPFLLLIYNRLTALDTSLSTIFGGLVTGLETVLGDLHTDMVALNTSLGTINTTLGQIDTTQRGMAADIAIMRQIMHDNREDSVAVTAQARETLGDLAASAGDYATRRDEPPPIDPFPFVSVPTGTTVQSLPTGGRLFSIPGGA